MTDFVIIGAGPAGMTAALYLARAGKRPVLLEPEVCGGQIATTAQVENYPAVPEVTGWELADTMRRQLEGYGVMPLAQRAVGIAPAAPGFLVSTQEQTLACRTVILANGVRRRKLECPGEQRLTGRGVCWCAVCDGPLYRDKQVAVIGGGNSALEDAAYLAGLCSHVFLIHRRETLRAEEALVEAVRRLPNVELLTPWNVAEIQGADAVQGLRLRHAHTGEERTVAVEGVFEAIGLAPDNAALLPPSALDEEGYVLAGEDCRTPTAFLYAAGDTRSKSLRQIITAAADGAAAASSALADLSGQI